MEPAQYKRKILLAITGLTPQVVTETLYALTQTEAVPFVPTDVFLLTTAEGAQRARLTLLSDDPGWFHRFCHDYAVVGVNFSAAHIFTLRAADGRDLNDIRTPAENVSVANEVTELVRKLTEDDECALHVSLAGGRKTMGFYAGYALSLFGRTQDRLSHVLVSQEFESVPEFYYPTPYSRVIIKKDGKPLDTRDGEVTLAEIPFVRLRDGLPSPLLDGNASFSDVVTRAQQSVESLRLEIDMRKKWVRAAGVEIHLPPAELAFLCWFARRKFAGLPGLLCPPDGVPDSDLAGDYLGVYREVVGEMGSDDRAVARLKNGMDKQFFLERKSRLKRHLQRELGRKAAPFLVDGIGHRPKRYELVLEAKSVRWI